jgi:hypothetical protein
MAILSLPLHYLYLLRRQLIKLVDQQVDLTIRRVDLALDLMAGTGPLAFVSLRLSPAPEVGSLPYRN